MHKPVLFNVSQAKQNNYKSILVSSFETTDMQWDLPTPQWDVIAQNNETEIFEPPVPY